MTELQLIPDWIITPGDRVITRRVESQRARDAASRRRMRELAKAKAVFA